MATEQKICSKQSQELIAELRAAATGHEEWHLVHAVTRNHHMVFTFCDSTNPRLSAEHWLALSKQRSPDVYRHMVVEQVTVYTPQEHLLQRAADCIEALIAGGNHGNGNEDL